MKQHTFCTKFTKTGCLEDKKFQNEEQKIFILEIKENG